MDLECDEAPSQAFSPLNRDNPLNRDTLQGYSESLQLFSKGFTIKVTNSLNSPVKVLTLL